MPDLKPKIIIITGKVNSGKTTMMEKFINDEKLTGTSPSGIIARGVFKDKIKLGFDVIDISDGTSKPLARIDNYFENGFSVGKYYFSEEAFDFARTALLNYSHNGVVFLDEAGPLELSGGGYSACLKTLLDSDIARLYIVVRSECLTEFIEKFLKSNPTRIIRVGPD
jgi:nucleoside-triphosphatase THEP1